MSLSLAELILLRRVLRPSLLASFVAVTAAGIVAVGYLFNLVLESEAPTSREILMLIKVLGPGCAKCVALGRAAREATDALGVTAEIEKVLDFPSIAGYGVMTTPALVIDEQVLFAGRVPTAGQLRDLHAPLAS